MNDQLIMENQLLVLKSTVEVYVHGTLELLKAGLDNTMMHQADTYDIMTTFSWYQINNIKEKEIKQTYNKVKDK